MFVRFSRLIAIAMAAVICFAIIVPMAAQRHETWLAVAAIALFVVYAVFNIALWLRYRP